MSNSRSSKLRDLTNDELIRQLITCEKAIRVKLNNNPDTPEELNILKFLYVERQDLLSELDWRNIAGEI